MLRYAGSREGEIREIFTESSQLFHPTGSDLRAEVGTHHDYFCDLAAIAR